MTKKVCGDCKVEKELTEFYKRNNYNGTNKTYYKTQCKECDIKRSSKWNKSNPDKCKINRARYQAKLNK